MRIVLAAFLAAVVLAGCVAPASHPSTAPTNPDGSSAVDTPQARTSYIVPAVPKFDVKDFLNDHDAFVRKDNERAQNKPTHEAARQDILARFKAYGLDTYRQNFTVAPGLPSVGPVVPDPQFQQANIIGIKWGQIRDKWVVVGGHYDTVTDDCALSGTPGVCPLRSISQGAYDDGSGTMLSVHLGKTFANTTSYYTMVFVAYDGEERGTEGARAFVQDLYVAPWIDPANSTSPFGKITVVGDIDLDMIGINWPGTNAPINVMTNSEALYQETLNFTVKGKGMPADQMIRKDSLKLGSSDYAQFWRVKDPAVIPTIFFISDFEEIGSPGQLPENVHTPTQNLGLPLVSFGAYPFWHLEDTVETMRLMAGDPPADALPHPNLEKGFQLAGDLAVHLMHLLACQPDVPVDAKVHP